MVAKESQNYEESSVSLLKFENVGTNVSLSDGGNNDRSDNLDSWTKVNSINETVDISYEKTAEKWTIPEGYQFLPEELFQIKNIPPPLVSLSWLELLNSDEESGEDSIPLSKLKKTIQKRKKLKNIIPLSRNNEEICNEKKQILKSRRKKQKTENPIKRNRGRPKKVSSQILNSESKCESRTDEKFWKSESDSSNLDAQDTVDSQVNNATEDSINYNEHDYFKPVESTTVEEPENKDKKRKRKKTNAAIQGVKIGGSKLSFPCFECGKSFSAASTLKSHQRIHNGTLLICPECQKGFVSKYLLKCHMRIHNGDLFMCHKCGRGFTTAELLKVHSRAHTGDRPFVCNICGKSFPTSSNMLQHKQIHNSEKKFLCSQCGSSFVQKRCLDYHMLTHAEKKNICNVCGKLWARKSDLIEHMRVHTGVKPYCCSICPQKFSQASSLKRHQLVHMDVKPISCVTCHKMFKCQEYYKRHLRKHEKEDYLFNDI